MESTTQKPRKVRSDAGVERSAYEERPCEAGCGNTVRRRVTDMRATAFCSLPCYRQAGSPHGGARGGRPRSDSTLLVETTDGVKTAVITDGYVNVYWPQNPMANKAGRVGQHRLVMAEILGRPLLPSERPHHKNGDRADNRPENLELWSTSQPPGQRVEDKVEWARALLGLYGDNDERSRYGGG